MPASGTTTGGSNGNGGSNGSAVPPLPGWFAQLGNLVARGAQVIAAAPASTPPASLPQDPGPLETIASVEWTTLCHVQSGVFVASFDEDSGPAVRVVDGRIRAVDFSAAEAMARSESARNWTIADWDGWFAVRGNDAPLSPASLAALQTALNVAVRAFGPGIHLNGETPFDPSLDDQQSLWRDSQPREL